MLLSNHSLAERLIFLKRAEWIDSCRFLAIFVIMLTHFLDKVSPAALSLWDSFLLYGLTGKFSVAFFFVLLGYFASRPTEFSPRDFMAYSLRRYLHFAFYIFVCSTLFICGSYAAVWVFHSPDDTVLRVISDGFVYNLIYLLRDSFLFESSYNATLWCMQQLFLASIVCKALAYAHDKINVFFRFTLSAVLIAVMMIIDADFFVWICAGILGYVLRLMLDAADSVRVLRSPALLAAMSAAALLFIKLRMPESVLQYSLQSIAALLLIYVQFNITAVQKILSAAPLPWLGGISMGLFVVHTPINCLLYSSVYSLMPSALGAVIVFFVSLALCILAAWILKLIYEKFSRLYTRSPVKV